jgi:hypothetical protein
MHVKTEKQVRVVVAGASAPKPSQPGADGMRARDHATKSAKVSESWGGVKVGPSQSKSESRQAEVKPVREIVLSPTRVERELAEENI